MLTSPESASPESPSSESPSSESLSPKPQSALFVDRGLKVQVWLDASVDKGGYNNGRGRGSPIFCDSLLDIDTPQDWWQMLRNLQRIIDLQFLSLLEASPEIVEVFVVWDRDVPWECDGWSEWSEWLKCKRWNDIGVKTMKLYKIEKGPRYRATHLKKHPQGPSWTTLNDPISRLSKSFGAYIILKQLIRKAAGLFTVQASFIIFDSEIILLTNPPSTQTPLDTLNQIFQIVLEHSAVGSEMSDQTSSSAQLSITPGLQIRAMNISDGSLPFLCNTTLGIV
ncbi:hypothetical protein BOTNAR_0077g00120 [Botryotinia narcissicola]|uniref:Uncharacterized protein n=1 Tax=Botryotinia narcissicola TaxID=278944 RepID=A0A4Z1IVR2_9HELO|nr:hypothetical protein BOTNAR_0077g00120 [Botryotinia narcissicola]